MNSRKPKITNTARGSRPTARSQIVSILSTEILRASSSKSFLLGSEYQLCRRFGVSRVTVRLALDDLKNHGLVYRKHGVGTFAHGQSTRVRRYIAVLLDLSALGQSEPLSQFLCGVKAYARNQHSDVIVTDHLPEDWRPELASILSGAIVMLDEVSPQSTMNLQQRELPYLVVGRTGLSFRLDQFCVPVDNNLSASHQTQDSFRIGQQAAESLIAAFFTGR